MSAAAWASESHRNPGDLVSLAAPWFARHQQDDLAIASVLVSGLSDLARAANAKSMDYPVIPSDPVSKLVLDSQIS